MGDIRSSLINEVLILSCELSRTIRREGLVIRRVEVDYRPTGKLYRFNNPNRLQDAQLVLDRVEVLGHCFERLRLALCVSGDVVLALLVDAPEAVETGL